MRDDFVRRLATAVSVGSLLGVLGARYLFVGSWISLIPWTLVGLTLGYWSTKHRPALVGAVYGFSLSFVFMVAGYTGQAPLLTRVLPFAVFGAFGGVCGCVLGLLGAFVGRHVR